MFKRVSPETPAPYYKFEGTASHCGAMLGEHWGESIRQSVEDYTGEKVASDTLRYAMGLLERYAPYLPEFLAAMLRAANVSEDHLYTILTACPLPSGCTSFAIHPSQTLDGIPISGQTKDTPHNRIEAYQVIGLNIKGGHSMLTATYAGHLYGHGFITEGCALFRNSLYAGIYEEGRLPYFLWGLLAQHMPNVEALKAFTQEHPPLEGMHVIAADEQGGILGIEAGKGGIGFLEADNGLYTHANHVCSGEELSQYQTDGEVYDHLEASMHREKQLFKRLNEHRNHLTTQLCYQALCDETNYPNSICTDCRPSGQLTTAAIIAEPTRRSLHVVRGVPNQNWPKTYTI